MPPVFVLRAGGLSSGAAGAASKSTATCDSGCSADGGVAEGATGDFVDEGALNGTVNKGRMLGGGINGCACSVVLALPVGAADAAGVLVLAGAG